ncbi:MAG: hypothetical protein P9L90_04555 [Candidatus Aadella gelida]|nr:hypothetical protein [Candidatus Aadella gelida]
MKKNDVISKKKQKTTSKKKSRISHHCSVDLRKSKLLLVTDPFRFVDRLTYCDPGKKVVVEYKVTGEEWFFKGHFPGNPVLPGHILAEAMIQAGSFLFKKRDWTKVVNYLYSTKIKFFKITKPGETIKMTGTPVKMLSSAAIIHVKAHSDGELVAQGDFVVATRKKDTI